MKWHRFPINEERRQERIAMISKARKNFIDGEPTTRYPNPSLLLTRHDELQATLKKRRLPAKHKTENVKIRKSNRNQVSVSPSKKFTSDYDIRFYTGFINQVIFRILFEFLKLKASTMTYWDEIKKILSKVVPLLSSPQIDPEKLNYAASKSGPSRKLSLETESILVLMKLRLDLLPTNLAYRFDVSPGKVSQIFITWIKLHSKQLDVLIIWPLKSQVRKTLAQCFKKLYPKVRTIIDCTEIYTETSSSLDSHCLLWSD